MVHKKLAFCCQIMLTIWLLLVSSIASRGLTNANPRETCKIIFESS